MEQDKIGMESLYIPKEIMKLLQNKELSLQEAFTLSIIDFLDSRGECFASNEFFGKSLGVSTERARKIISSLYDKKYINRKVIYKNGTTEVDKRILKVNIKTTKAELNNTPMVKNDQGVWSNITRGTVENDHIKKSREKSNIIYTCNLHYTSTDYNFSNLINDFTKNPHVVRALEKYIDMRNELSKEKKERYITERGFKLTLANIEHDKDDIKLQRIYRCIDNKCKSIPSMYDNPFTEFENIAFNKFIDSIEQDIKKAPVGAGANGKTTYIDNFTSKFGEIL